MVRVSVVAVATALWAVFTEVKCRDIGEPATGRWLQVCERVLVDVCIGAVTRIAANGTQTGATPPL
jgi:hypothetical protein